MRSMIAVRELWARLASYFRKQRLDLEFDEELAAHVDLATQDHLRQGMALPEARRLALIKLGGIEPAKEVRRDSRGLPWIDGIGQDVRYAARALRRSPGFTLTAVATLAVGIGVNAAVFTVTNATLFKGFPLVERNDRILYMTMSRGCCVSYPDFEDWRAQATSFEGMALVHGSSITFSDRGGFPESYTVTEISADTFKLAGQKPMLGRDFVPSDETPGAPPVAILRYGFWERRLAKDPAVVGRTVWLNGRLTTVIGVMPPGFSFPQNQDLWVPLVPTPEVRTRENHDTWFVFGRLAEGVTVAAARAEMRTIGQRLERAYPATNRGLLPQLRNFREFFIGSNATLIYQTMWGAVGFVLLIACANLANLLLARAMGRAREISLRIALGAGRWRIIRQLLLESVLLSGLGGFFGWLIANWGVRLYALAATGQGVSDETPGDWFDNILDYSTDSHVLAYVVVISIATGLLFGLAPASRLSKLDVNGTLKDGGRGAAGSGRGRHLSALLVIAEMTLAVVLLAGAGVMIRSFLKVYTADVGFNTDNILATNLGLPRLRYPTEDARMSFYSRLEPRLNALPGVTSVAMVSSLPGWGDSGIPFELAGAPPAETGRRPRATRLVISPAYFRTLIGPLHSGREFNDGDGVSAAPVAIVNQRFASQHWPGENPLGKRLRLVERDAPGAWLTVVGIAPNIAQNTAVQRELEPEIYLPYQQKPGASMWLLARTSVPPGGLVTAFRRQVQAIDPVLPISPALLAEKFGPAYQYQYRGLAAAVFVVFAAIALLLASGGLYAVIAHSVSQRTQEIGVRMAIGASARDIRSLVIRQGVIPLGIGLAVGLAASLAVNRVLKTQLVEVSPADPVTLAIVSAVLAASAMCGCLIPVRRAMRVDPVVALRQE
jgi:putative ABC transport system permease protein